MKKQTVKAATILMDQIQRENDIIMALRQWVDELMGLRSCTRDNPPAKPPTWSKYMDNGRHVAVTAPVDQFCFILELDRLQHERRLKSLEDELSALQDESIGPVSDVDYEER